jgi:hypothetical protein
MTYLNRWSCKSCYNDLCKTCQKEIEKYPLPNFHETKCIWCDNVADYFICISGKSLNERNYKCQKKIK